MNVGDFIFVYGTLKRGDHNNQLLKNAEFIGEDRIAGARIYDLGYYPGLKLADDTQDGVADPDVFGEVYRITDTQTAANLDRLEGYPHHYGRSEVFTATGTKVWVYVYNGNVREDDRLMTGVWPGEPRDDHAEYDDSADYDDDDDDSADYDDIPDNDDFEDDDEEYDIPDEPEMIGPEATKAFFEERGFATEEDME